MNKITLKTFDLHCREMSHCIEELTTSGSNGRSQELFKLVLNICSTNRGYNADVYAAMIKEVTRNVPSMHNCLIEYVNSYKDEMSSLNHVSPYDYSQFCACKTSKEHRKGSQALIKNLEVCGAIPLNIVMEILVLLVDKLLEWCGVREKSSEMEELVEHLYLFTVGNIRKLCDQSLWCQTLFPKILTLTRLRISTNGNCSVSSRAHFRFKDVVRMQAVLTVERVGQEIRG